jgi:predicted O-methyltransferase YrrM
MKDEERWTAVDRWFTDRLRLDDPALQATLSASTAGGLPAINVSPPLGMLLYLLARACNARRILEIGTLGGYSAIWLGRALPANGRLITLEADPHHARVATENIARAGLASRVEVRVGRAQDSLPALQRDQGEPFDLVFIDADKPGYPEYFRWAQRLTLRGSLIIADNVVREGAILDPHTEDANVQGTIRFLEDLAAEAAAGRLIATAIQTVGSKGYDGFSLALVTAE